MMLPLTPRVAEAISLTGDSWVLGEEAYLSTPLADPKGIWDNKLEYHEDAERRSHDKREKTTTSNVPNAAAEPQMRRLQNY